jgi:hypothetical protein
VYDFSAEKVREYSSNMIITTFTHSRTKLSCNDHKYSILSKSLSLKGSGIFINENLIPEDQAELRKEVQKVKEARKEGKWAIIRNRKAIVKDRD